MRFAIVGLFASLLLLPLLNAEAPSEVEEYQLKAAFLFRFAQFVDWPLDTSGTSLTFCIVGRDPFRGGLETGLRGKSVAGKTVQVRYVSQVRDVRECQVAFVQLSERSSIHDLLSIVAGMPVLTVGESEDFLQQGGIIRFCMEERKVRFEINQSAAQRAHLNISSRLLMLAKTVIGSGQDK